MDGPALFKTGIIRHRKHASLSGPADGIGGVSATEHGDDAVKRDPTRRVKPLVGNLPASDAILACEQKRLPSSEPRPDVNVGVLIDRPDSVDHI